MKKYLENFYKLYSDDDKAVYEAVLEKHKWLNKEFYLIMQLENNVDLEDLFEGRLRFKKLYLNPYHFNKNEELYKEANNYFNDNFRVLYLLEELPQVDEKIEFIAKIDFSKCPTAKYNELFPNFFPCLELNEIKQVTSTGLEELFPICMNKELGDGVLILSVDVLKENCYYTNVVSEIIMGAYMNDAYEVYLKQLSASIGAKFRRLNKNDY